MHMCYLRFLSNEYNTSNLLAVNIQIHANDDWELAKLIGQHLATYYRANVQHIPYFVVTKYEKVQYN